MPSSRLLLLIALGGLPWMSGLAVEPALPAAGPITTTRDTLDQEVLMRRERFGYTEAEIQRWFPQPMVREHDLTGLAKDRIKAPPAPGVHPRVWLHPQDLPALRRKLADTKPGKLQMDGIRKTMTALLTGPNAKYAALYAEAIAGTANPALAEVEPACAIEYECFRCLVDEDVPGGRKAAAALASLATAEAKILEDLFAKNDPKAPKAADGAPLRDYQQSKNITQAGMLALAYDFAYPWLDEAQRTTVRKTLVLASSHMTLIGAEALPAFPAGTSNWIPMHLRLVLATLAIEGEPGYDPTTYQRCLAAYRNYLGPGLFPAGDMFESMGKNFICTENLAPLADRGDNLLGLARLRRQIDHYYLHALDPWGGHFTFYDSLGGRGNTTPMFDVLVMKHYFPDDPAIDFVYRNTVGDDYAAFKDTVRFGHPFHLNDGVVKAIFGEPYDEAKSWDQARDLAVQGRPLTFFSNDTGNLITASAWTKDAAQFHVLTRSVAGGHIYCDRGHFSLHALGRYWGVYLPMRQVESHYSPRNRSVVLIDGEGPGMAPAKCVGLADGPGATLIAADLKSSFAWTTGGNNRFPKGGVPVPYCANDFRLVKSPLPWMDAPYSDLPNWQTSQKGSEQWLPHHPVAKAYRSGGLIRGPHPYAVVVDDVRLDDAAHEYRWGMILESDLGVENTDVQAGAAQFRNDVILSPAEDPQHRRLLVRVLQAEGLADPRVPAAITPFSLEYSPGKQLEIHRLEITATTVEPKFKVLLFPHVAGADLPATTWNADHTEVTIRWTDQQDVLSFREDAEGRTRVTARREGKVLAALE